MNISPLSTTHPPPPHTHTQSLLSDVSFRVEGKIVHAHKLVLCTRCDVMSAMFSGGFVESQSNEVIT